MDVHGGSDAEIQNRFFTIPANAPAVVHKVAAALKKQNEIGGFIPSFAKKEGYAVWSKSVINISEPPASTYGRNGEFETQDTVEVFTPIVLENGNLVNGFFFSRVLGDSVAIHLYRANDYDMFPNGKADSSLVTAELITMKLLELNDEIFGHRKYELIDSNIFKPERPGYHFRTIETDTTTTFAGKAAPCDFTCLYLQTEACISTTNWCTFCQLIACWSNCPATGGGGTSGGPIGGGYNWPPDPPITGGSGGGGGGGGSTGNCIPGNCRTNSTLIAEGRIPCGGCGSGPIIVIPPEPEPCDPYIATLKNDINFVNNFKYLQSSPIRGLPFETGCTVRRSTNTYGYKSGTSGSKEIEWDINSAVDGLLHCHYEGLNSMFTADDVVFMARIHLKGLANDPANLFFGITSSYGMPTLMKVKNAAAFTAFAVRIVGANGDDLVKRERFLSDYKFKFSSPNPDTNEKEFLQMLRRENALGAVTLYRGVENCDYWTELGINDFDEVTDKPCD